MEPQAWPTRYLSLKFTWFCVTTDEHSVPKDTCSGHYANTYVYLIPNQGEQLRLLTMAALDIANVDLTQINRHLPDLFEPQ